MTPSEGSGEGARFTLDLTGEATRCEIVVGRGALAGLADHAARHAPAARYAVIADEAVAGGCGRDVVAALRDADRAVDLFSLPGGERSKTLGRWAELMERLAVAGFGRDGAVIAVGGGVTGDLAGFAAAAFARGVAFIQVPTTLLAMVDAAIGGKTGVDLEAGKNLAGAFHMPRLVVIDPELLDTLPPAPFADGLAECVKHGAVADADYFRWIVDTAADLTRREPTAIDRLVEGSVRIKAGVVARDPYERGERAILNFGHTIAHAIERATGYGTPHGQAVAMGMTAEAAAGEAAGVSEAGTGDRIRDALRRLGLPGAIPDDLRDRATELIDAARVDKKSRHGTPRYALIARVGVPARPADGGWTHELDPDVVLRAVRADL